MNVRREIREVFYRTDDPTLIDWPIVIAITPLFLIGGLGINLVIKYAGLVGGAC